MNTDEVRACMAVAAAIDPTMPAADDDVVAVWAAMLDDVPGKIGASAVHWYYRSDAYRDHKRTITPADIFGYYKRQANDWREKQKAKEIIAAERAIEAAPRELPSIHGLFARFQAEKRGQDPDMAEADASARRFVMTVTCPYCKAQPGQQCTTITGRVLARELAHPKRIEVAHAHI
ncbi:hypothetical protein ABT324_24160 [Saccharopolyspora sp. NPDC000359]|uniref:zinc finger domain-containing protein n=1 Tax=Saccharopolyspora sp. NPDC000359 TaxID=3154251 RepID=UPI003320AF46